MLSLVCIHQIEKVNVVNLKHIKRLSHLLHSTRGWDGGKCNGNDKDSGDGSGSSRRCRLHLYSHIFERSVALLLCWFSFHSFLAVVLLFRIHCIQLKYRLQFSQVVFNLHIVLAVKCFEHISRFRLNLNDFEFRSIFFFPPIRHNDILFVSQLTCSGHFFHSWEIGKNSLHFSPSSNAFRANLVFTFFSAASALLLDKILRFFFRKYHFDHINWELSLGETLKKMLCLLSIYPRKLFWRNPLQNASVW